MAKNEFVKTCSNSSCQAQIIMSKDESTGKWHPKNEDGSIHRCMGGSTNKQTQEQAHTPQQQNNGTPTAVLFTAEEIKTLKEIIQVFQEFKKK